MKHVTVLGPGCKRCDTTEAMVKDAAARIGVDVKVDKVTDYADIAKFGIASTPGIVIDGKVVHAGGATESRGVGKVAADMMLVYAVHPPPRCG